MATILVIEDADAIRFTMAASLRFHGHTVIEACNGREGIERHAQALGEFDLIVCDLFMPELGGAETIRKLHSRAPDLPILAVSGGRNALDYVRTYSGSTLVSTLAKPFSVQAFVQEVEHLLALRAA